MTISKRVRFEIFKRDLFTCRYCGQRPPEVVLEVDHIIAVANGGSDDPDNLCTSCFACNRGKSDRDLGATVPAVDELARLAAIQEMNERAALLQRQQHAAAARAAAESAVLREIRAWWIDAGGNAGYLCPRSLRRFLELLSLQEIRWAIDRAGAKLESSDFDMLGEDMWRYFCGTCWKLIQERGRR